MPRTQADILNDIDLTVPAIQKTRVMCNILNFIEQILPFL